MMSYDTLCVMLAEEAMEISKKQACEVMGLSPAALYCDLKAAAIGHGLRLFEEWQRKEAAGGK